LARGKLARAQEKCVSVLLAFSMYCFMRPAQGALAFASTISFFLALVKATFSLLLLSAKRTLEDSVAAALKIITSLPFPFELGGPFVLQNLFQLLQEHAPGQRQGSPTHTAPVERRFEKGAALIAEDHFSGGYHTHSAFKKAKGLIYLMLDRLLSILYPRSTDIHA